MDTISSIANDSSFLTMPPCLSIERGTNKNPLTANVFSSPVLDSIYTNDVSVFDEAALGVYERKYPVCTPP